MSGTQLAEEIASLDFCSTKGMKDLPMAWHKNCVIIVISTDEKIVGMRERERERAHNTPYIWLDPSFVAEWINIILKPSSG